MTSFRTSHTFALVIPMLTCFSACAADWSNTDVEYRQGSRFNDNGASGGAQISKQLLEVQNSSGFASGRSYFFLLMSKADAADGDSGDLYSEGQATFSLSKVGLPAPALPLVKDVGLTVGYNFGARNSAFRPNTRVLVAGPTFDLSVPGFNYFNLDVLAYRDTSTYGGFGGGRLCGQPATAYQLTPYWQATFNLGAAHFIFDGYTDIIGAHGSCARQVLAEPQLRLDVGRMWGVPGTFQVGVEIQHWRNKYGTLGVRETVPQLVLRWRL